MNQKRKTETPQIPDFRFKIYSENWGLQKLCDFAFKVNDKNKETKYLETLTNSAEFGIINQREFFEKDISNKANLKNYYVVYPNDFVYNPRISNFAPFGPINRNKLGRIGVMSPLYYVFRVRDQSETFLEYYFSSSKWHKFMYINGDQGARSDRFAISGNVFQQMPICLPSLKEQTQIGEFFQTIDRLIELQSEKVAQAERYKKAMLQKLFPQKGETIPKLRFAGFSGAWEEKKLGDLADITTGKLDANAMKEDGKYDFYTSGIQKYKIDVPAFKGPAITIAGNGATVGYMHYADGEFNAYQRTYVLTNFKALREYLFVAIGQNLPRKIHAEARTGNIPYIVMGMLTDLEIPLPSPEEQTQIGNFFQILDKRIEAEGQKLERYQTLKRAMLQRMFV